MILYLFPKSRISATASPTSKASSRYSQKAISSSIPLFANVLLFSSLAVSFFSACVHAMTLPARSKQPSPRGIAFAASLPPLFPTNKRFILVRHGQTDWNAQGLMQGGGYDIPLNEEGNSQGRRLAEELSGLVVGGVLNVIASSHLQRSLQTANYIVGGKDDSDDKSTNNDNSFDRPVVVDSRFGEMRFGSFEGTAIHGPQATAEHRARFQDMTQRMKSDIYLAWPDPDPDSICSTTSTVTAAMTSTIVEAGAKTECTWDVSQRGEAGISDLLAAYPDESHLCVVAHGRFNKVLLATMLWKDPSRFKEMEQGNTCINIIDYHPPTDTWEEVILNYTDHAADTANAKKALNTRQR